MLLKGTNVIYGCIIFCLIKKSIDATKKIVTSILIVGLIACEGANNVPEVHPSENIKITKLLTTHGVHSVSELLANSDRAVCVLGQAGGYSKVDRYGYLEKIEQLKFPWIHGFLAEIGITTDWYWTLIIFDEKNNPRVLRIDRGKDVDLSYATKQLCYGPKDNFSVQINTVDKKSAASVAFQ